MQLFLLLLLLLLSVAGFVQAAPHWPLSRYDSDRQNYSPLTTKQARFASPLIGFSNIFQDAGNSGWDYSAFPSIERRAWSQYPSGHPMQPLPLARRQRPVALSVPQPVPTYQSLSYLPPTRRQPVQVVPTAAPALQPALMTSPPPPPQAPQLAVTGQRAGRVAAPSQASPIRFVPAADIQGGQVPTVFMTEADIHGLVCVPASSLGSALGAHRDSVVTSDASDSAVLHRTVLAGTAGGTRHRTSVTSGAGGTSLETRTNSSSGRQRHRQTALDTGSGLVRSSTGTAESAGRPGQPTFTDVLTSSKSGSRSQSASRATASGFHGNSPIPASSRSHSATGPDTATGQVAALTAPDPTPAAAAGPPTTKTISGLEADLDTKPAPGLAETAEEESIPAAGEEGDGALDRPEGKEGSVGELTGEEQNRGEK